MKPSQAVISNFMPHTKKTIAVIITTKNRPIELREALQSVISQTRQPNEIIVVDDASDSLYCHDIIMKLDCKNTNVIRFEKTQGGSVARNSGADKATSEVIMFLDDDDTWESEKIDRQMKIFENEDVVGLVYSGRLIVFANNRQHILYKVPALESGYLFPRILFHNAIGVTSSVAIRRDIFEMAGKFDVNLKARQDYDLWIRVCKLAKVVADGGYHLRYTYSNVLGEQLSSKTIGHIEAIKFILKKYEKEIKSLGLLGTQKIKAEKYFYLAKIFRKQSLYSALKWVFYSLFCWPSLKTLMLILPESWIRHMRSKT